jgi:hypothetical protein
MGEESYIQRSEANRKESQLFHCLEKSFKGCPVQNDFQGPRRRAIDQISY